MNPNQPLPQKKANQHNMQVADKLHGLVNTLQHANNGFKHIAERCQNRKTQTVVFGLATETFQVYKELASQMQVLKCKDSINHVLYNDCKTDIVNEQQAPKIDDTDKVLDECTQIEKNLITEFRKLLNDSLISGDLRKLLQAQLNSFLYSFVKLKMLRNYQSKTIDYGIIF
ncbi:DUF2383 domain-containing protein [Ilyomonas limi]|nr:DUF2383 domain-containing protein [Ilyomonas limi]